MVSTLAVCLPATATDLSLPVTGNLLGSVVDASNIPQMGASVQLFNRYERLIAKTFTATDGKFAFAGLAADSYAIKVSLPSFLPAVRDNIAIRAGTSSVLQIHLATLFSGIELRYTIPDGAMGNDWRWVLRSSPATRPITRLLPDKQESATPRPRVFSGTRAMLSVSGGDGGLFDGDSTQTDFGTGFALSTNVLGKNQISIGGTMGQNASFGPAAMALSAIYSRDETGPLGQAPEVTFSVSQFGMLGPPLSGQTNVASGGGPVVRTMSLSMYQTADPTDGVHLEYGMSAESVEYLQHTTRVSPFARLTAELGAAGTAILSYSDGSRPDELSAHQAGRFTEADANCDDLAAALNALSRMPQMSDHNGRLELQRTQSYEAGYRKVSGSRTYSASAFYEDVSNGRISVAGDLTDLDSGSLLSDGVSNASTYNIGRYHRHGYIASVNQKAGRSLDLAIAYGRIGGLTASDFGERSDGGLGRTGLNERERNFASASLNGRLQTTGTSFSAEYGWVDSGTVVPRHVFTTQNVSALPGLNIALHQPLPSVFGMPGHMEITADLRNLLAQGYLPVSGGDGHSLLLLQSPRMVRGGLNFIF